MSKARLGLGSPLLVLATLSALLIIGCSTDDVPSEYARAQEVNKSVMCPVCPGESIDQSQHPLAVQMRGIVDEKLRQGLSADQIRAHFVEGYGPSVLLDPPRTGFNLTAWVVPPVSVVVFGLILVAALRTMSRPGRPVSDDSDSLTAGEREQYFARIELAEQENGGDSAS